MNNLKTAKEKIEFLEINSPEEFVIEAGFDTTLTDSFFEMMRPLQWLHNMARQYIGGGQNKVCFRNVKGMLDSKTKYYFITQGLPGKIQKGLSQILNLKSQEEITAELKRFEAIVRLVCIRNKKYIELNDDMIAEQMRTNQISVDAGRETYDESDWWTIIKGANDYSQVMG